MRALLTYLAVERAQAHRRAMLAGRLWPEVPETAAHHNLSQTRLLLRRLPTSRVTLYRRPGDVRAAPPLAHGELRCAGFAGCGGVAGGTRRGGGLTALSTQPVFVEIIT